MTKRRRKPHKRREHVDSGEEEYWADDPTAHDVPDRGIPNSAGTDDYKRMESPMNVRDIIKAVAEGKVTASRAARISRDRKNRKSMEFFDFNLNQVHDPNASAFGNSPGSADAGAQGHDSEYIYYSNWEPEVSTEAASIRTVYVKRGANLNQARTILRNAGYKFTGRRDPITRDYVFKGGDAAKAEELFLAAGYLGRFAAWPTSTTIVNLYPDNNIATMRVEAHSFATPAKESENVSQQSIAEKNMENAVRTLQNAGYKIVNSGDDTVKLSGGNALTAARMLQHIGFARGTEDTDEPVATIINLNIDTGDAEVKLKKREGGNMFQKPGTADDEGNPAESIDERLPSWLRTHLAKTTDVAQRAHIAKAYFGVIARSKTAPKTDVQAAAKHGKTARRAMNALGGEPQKTPAKLRQWNRSIFRGSDERNEAVGEVAPPGFSGTIKKMLKHKKITNPYALAWSMYKKGDKPHEKPVDRPEGLKRYIPPAV